MIKTARNYLKIASYLLLLVSLGACADNTSVNNLVVQLDVFKSPTCDCCGKWVSHIDSLGFEATTHHPADLNLVKQKLGIAPQYQSCHTGVSKEGYIFEGHVPADIMQRFLTEKPEGALGLAVPGMPIGSPGMEMGDRYDDYDVLLLKKDGSSEVYERIRPKS
ncbi:MAG TPA: DUF411 domain-containing protein [Cycloclasticus sp.]|jgi:hypothetical protein|nr:DUF411 domain-containing protein [Cycloclasticus sp.]HIL91843.1 DUF411 domain-containing protein [Cycloclasticus sp.]